MKEAYLVRGRDGIFLASTPLLGKVEHCHLDCPTRRLVWGSSSPPSTWMSHPGLMFPFHSTSLTRVAISHTEHICSLMDGWWANELGILGMIHSSISLAVYLKISLVVHRRSSRYIKASWITKGRSKFSAFLVTFELGKLTKILQVRLLSLCGQWNQIQLFHLISPLRLMVCLKEVWVVSWPIILLGPSAMRLKKVSHLKSEGLHELEQICIYMYNFLGI